MTSDFVISLLKPVCEVPVYRYRSEYDFETPAVFVQIVPEEGYSFSRRATLNIWITFQEEETLSDVVQRIDDCLHKGYWGSDKNVYVYQILKSEDDSEDLGNGFSMKKLTYKLLYEEVQ